MSVTKFGKMLRELRHKKDINLKEMGEKLGFSSAHISALELGKKNVPDKFLQKINKIFNLDPEAYEKLKQTAKESVTTIKIDLKKDDEFERHLVSQFARTYKTLDFEKKKKIEKLLMGD